VGYAFSGPSGSVPGTGTLTLADGGRFSSGSDLLIGQGSTGTVSVTGPSSTLTVAALVNLGISGGTGTLTIGAGGTVSAGSLNLGHFSNDSATLNLATGGTLRVGGTVTGSLSPSSVFNFAGGTWQVTGSALSTALPLTLTNTSTLDTNGLNASLTGVLSGSGALTKTGAGTLTLAAANTYTGGTAITGGLVNFSSSANFGTGSVTIDGGGLQWATGTSTDFSPRLAPLGAGGATFATNGNAVTFATALSGAGGLTKSGAGTLTLAAANTYTGGTTVTAGTLQLGNGGSLTGNVANQGTLVFNRSDDSAFAGIISGSGGVVLASGILRLTQAQTYTGPTQINSGILVLPTTTAQGLSASTLVTMASGAALDLSNRAQTLTGLVGAGTVYSYGGNSGSLELVVAPGQTQTFSGSLGGDYPAFALTKSGTGTLTLSGTHTYTGATAVNVGSLFVNGTLGATPLSLASGATLGGTGTLGGLTTLSSGAHLAPGNSPGTLTFTHGLTLLASSILDFELGTTSDLIRVSGGTLTGPTSGLVTLNLTDAGGFAAGTYTLFDFTSAATSSFDAADFTFGTTLPGYTYALSLTGGTLQLTATASAIPEPSTYAALLGAAALALAAHRRRQIRSHSS
jgi:autotransporter-associated beta strand protein/T5SS/PEP-CTERM-associated repeat protein